MRLAGVVVKYDHESLSCKNFDSVIKNLHCRFSVELWIGLDEVLRDDVVVIEHLERVSKTDAVHMELVSNVHNDVFKWPAFEPIHAMSGHVTTGPVGSCEFDSSPVCIDDGGVFCGQGELYVMGLADCLHFQEMAHVNSVLLLEILMFCEIV